MISITKTITCVVADAGRVKLGAMSPSLPVVDAGRVKLGAMSPAI